MKNEEKENEKEMEAPVRKRSSSASRPRSHRPASTKAKSKSKGRAAREREREREREKSVDRERRNLSDGDEGLKPRKLEKTDRAREPRRRRDDSVSVPASVSSPPQALKLEGVRNAMGRERAMSLDRSMERRHRHNLGGVTLIHEDSDMTDSDEESGFDYDALLRERERERGMGRERERAVSIDGTGNVRFHSRHNTDPTDRLPPRPPLGRMPASLEISDDEDSTSAMNRVVLNRLLYVNRGEGAGRTHSAKPRSGDASIPGRRMHFESEPLVIRGRRLDSDLQRQSNRSMEWD
ncbi:hypothetical protein KIPB_007409 [Kipferlia bialata]|uniref:Uncharacterized protein n=1 Tax=Kipferlia bialata TaxID=797122 RepID=A0A9K3CYJ3_9EUKA|nr:hypothetical protein KIPB_007409 [Kipferlia bialata]|eukprot:g7409.t1